MTNKLKFWPGAVLLNFVVDTFVGKRDPRVGKGVFNARRDLDAHRAAQAERLKDADDREITRQQERQMQRRVGKMPIGMTMKDWHRKNGYPV